jgi:sulfur carrier protein
MQTGTFFLNGQPTPLEHATVADLLQALGWATRPVAVEFNGEILRRARHAEQRITAGDRIELVTAIGGG